MDRKLRFNSLAMYLCVLISACAYMVIFILFANQYTKFYEDFKSIVAECKNTSASQCPQLAEYSWMDKRTGEYRPLHAFASGDYVLRTEYLSVSYFLRIDDGKIIGLISEEDATSIVEHVK